MNNWIDVEKKLPIYYKDCLVVDNDLRYIAARVANPEGWIAIETNIRLYNVKCWMHLPVIPGQ